MIHPTQKIADSWLELLLVIGFLLLLFPVIIVLISVAVPFLACEAIWNWLRKAPKPTSPSLGIDTDRESKIVAKELASEAK